MSIKPVDNGAIRGAAECWYCGPCAARCPTGAVPVNLPYRLMEAVARDKSGQVAVSKTIEELEALTSE